MPRKGFKQSAETKAKISAAMKGRGKGKPSPKKGKPGVKHTAEAKAKISAAMKGKKKSAEHRAKIAEAKKGEKRTAEAKAKMSAAKHKYYGTDPTDENRKNRNQRKWAKEVKERDNHTCQYCGAEEELHAHHIFSASKWPFLAQNLNNGITLCKSCHTWHHKHNFLA